MAKRPLHTPSSSPKSIHHNETVHPGDTPSTPEIRSKTDQIRHLAERALGIVGTIITLSTPVFTTACSFSTAQPPEYQPTPGQKSKEDTHHHHFEAVGGIVVESSKEGTHVGSVIEAEVPLHNKVKPKAVFKIFPKTDGTGGVEELTVGLGVGAPVPIAKEKVVKFSIVPEATINYAIGVHEGKISEGFMPEVGAGAKLEIKDGWSFGAKSTLGFKIPTTDQKHGKEEATSSHGNTLGILGVQGVVGKEF